MQGDKSTKDEASFGKESIANLFYGGEGEKVWFATVLNQRKEVRQNLSFPLERQDPLLQLQDFLISISYRGLQDIELLLERKHTDLHVLPSNGRIWPAILG